MKVPVLARRSGKPGCNWKWTGHRCGSLSCSGYVRKGRLQTGGSHDALWESKQVKLQTSNVFLVAYQLFSVKLQCHVRTSSVNCPLQQRKDQMMMRGPHSCTSSSCCKTSDCIECLTLEYLQTLNPQPFRRLACF